MLRVGIGGSLGLVQRIREAELLVDDNDGLTTFETNDRSLDIALNGQRTIFNGSDQGKRLTDGELTWIATVNRLPGTNFARVSIVIMRNRDRGFVTRVNSEGVADQPRDNSQDERLAYVVFANGFRGGGGGNGRDRLALAITVSDIAANDWVMLSRRSAAGIHIHRWFRVVTVGAEALETTWTDQANATHQVWEQKLFLDGPDWTFGFGSFGGSPVQEESADISPTGSGPSISNTIDNTYVTLMKDVITVSEYTINLE